MFLKKCSFGLSLLILASCSSKSVDNPAQLYFPQVKNIIQANCITCHQPGGQGMPIFFTSDANIVANAAFIKAAVADPITIHNKRMPLGGSLSASDINIIVQWYTKGGRATD